MIDPINIGDSVIAEVTRANPGINPAIVILVIIIIVYVMIK